jgi:hypothetical protein
MHYDGRAAAEVLFSDFLKRTPTAGRAAADNSFSGRYSSK